MIGLAPHVLSDAEFMRRARLSIREMENPGDFLNGIAVAIDANAPITGKRLAAMYEALHERRHRYSDQAVKDTARIRMREAKP